MEKAIILLVEDERLHARLFKDFLADYDYHLLVCYTGQSAIWLIETEEKEYDLLIVDISLGDFAGTDVVSCSKRKDPNIPVLTISAYGDYEIVGTNFQADRHLTKPFTQRMFISAIEQLLQRVF